MSRKSKRRRHYGDGPSSGGPSFGQMVFAVVVGTVAASWVTALLPVTPQLPAAGMSGFGRR